MNKYALLFFTTLAYANNGLPSSLPPTELKFGLGLGLHETIAGINLGTGITPNAKAFMPDPAINLEMSCQTRVSPLLSLSLDTNVSGTAILPMSSYIGLRSHWHFGPNSDIGLGVGISERKFFEDYDSIELGGSLNIIQPMYRMSITTKISEAMYSSIDVFSSTTSPFSEHAHVSSYGANMSSYNLFSELVEVSHSGFFINVGYIV